MNLQLPYDETNTMMNHRGIGNTRVVPRFPKMALPACLLLGSVALAESPRALSVCEAAKTGDHLDGETVRIKGVWRQAFPQLGLFDELTDSACAGVEIRVVANAESAGHIPPADYKLDAKSTRIAQRIARKALADRRDLSATMVGVLYVQKKEDYIPARPLNKAATVSPHHKWYPMVLLIESVPEVKER